ncbi:MAG: hypothetical protein V3V33_10695 [Candidatus Lokiarchaeia archaeon]
MKEKFIISLISQVMSYFISIIAFYLLFLNLDTSFIGTWTLVTSIVNLGFLFLNIGLDSIHYQYSSKENSSEYFGTFFTLKLSLLSINVLVSILVIFFISFFEVWSNDFLYLILILLFSKIVTNISSVFLINLKSRFKVFKAEIPSFLIISGKSVMVIILSLNLTYINDPLLFLCVSTFVFDLLLLLLILLVSKKEFKLNRPSKAFTLLYLKDIIPLFFFSFTLVIASNFGNILLAASFDHETLGNFSFINNYVIQSLLVISSSLVTVYLTLFSKFFEKGDFDSIKKTTYIIEKYSSIIFLGIIIVVILNGKLILSILLPQYVDTVPILNIMVFFPYLMAITQPYSYHFIAGKKQKINAQINIFTRIMIILLMIYLIPTSFFILPTLGLGTIGYAISQTIPWILWVFLNRYYSYKTFNIKPQKNIVYHIPIAIISFLISFAFKLLIFEKIFQNQILLLIITTILSLAIFIFILVVIKELKREDIRFFLQLIKFQTYKNSLKEELLN